MCQCMRVSRNAFYQWRKSLGKKGEKDSLVLLKDRIESIFHKSKQIYGSYRIQKILEREGLVYSRSYVAVLMRKMGLRSVLRRKYVVTTDSDHSYNVSENVLDRNFHSNKLGQKWVSDITYIRVNNDWNYLTIIMDLADRKIIGWSLSEDMTAENTIMKAWQHARANRSIADRLIFHSDRGVQYASKKATNLLGINNKLIQSMSRKGNCWDNSVAESFFKTIKNEWIYRFKYNSYNQLYCSLKEYIEWYNKERIHSTLGYISPLEMEEEIRRESKKAA